MKNRIFLRSAAAFSLILFITETSPVSTLFHNQSGILIKFLIVFVSLLIISKLRLRRVNKTNYLQRLWGTLKVGSSGVLIFIVLSWIYYGFYHIRSQPFIYGATDRIPLIGGIAAVKIIEVAITSIFSFKLRKV